MRFFPCLIAALLLSTQAFASVPCYAPEEMQAEQLLRLHSELMVIAVSCRYGSNGQNLVSAYTSFTRNNLADIRQAEQTLRAYYAKNFGDKTNKRLDELRTRLGNEFGQQMANVSAPAFCAQRRDKVGAICVIRSGDGYARGRAEQRRLAQLRAGLRCSSFQGSTERGAKRGAQGNVFED